MQAYKCLCACAPMAVDTSHVTACVIPRDTVTCQHACSFCPGLRSCWPSRVKYEARVHGQQPAQTAGSEGWFMLRVEQIVYTNR